MAIEFNVLGSVVKIQGDGSSTSVVVDLAHVPLSYDNTFVAPILRPDNLPVAVQSVTLDNSASGVSASLTGALMTVTFTTAPSSGQHNLAFTLSFATT